MTRLWDTARRKRLNCPKVLTLVPARKHRTERSLKKRDWTICLIKPLIVHKCIICIGSNYNRKENLLLARRRLVDLFPTIRFTSEQETRPLFFSEAEEERVRKELKAIEQSAGRRPEDKKEEKVSLDIDLLSFDDRVLKPEDLKREYVVKGLEELKYNQI
ncbi:2-amino-4-hydroxy-6-hydroxymethyldihydropteridine pyrophosphokinase [Bacteroides thetaiotaomicron]|nr:2-amino-4-hydroxy-6-hydroxymethyldihydropteridine pyrophosphokinase [Bacteroides thetaiotaomicron]